MSVAVVILGDGTAGWMTAAALSKALDRTGTPITLVQSQEVGTVSIGKATIPTIHWFNELVGLDEARLVADTGATFKLGTKFRGWQSEGSTYFDPFATCGASGDGGMLSQQLARAWLYDDDARIEYFSLATQFAHARHLAKTDTDPRSLLSTLGYAFQVDRDGEAGHVRTLTTDRDPRIEGDMLVDCSGFRGLLIEQTMRAGYYDRSRFLPCDQSSRPA